jgi:hypothetical protein
MNIILSLNDKLSFSSAAQSLVRKEDNDETSNMIGEEDWLSGA